MTVSPRDRARSLLKEALATENHDAKVRLSEEAVDLADLASDDHLAYRARAELVEAATFGGQPVPFCHDGFEFPPQGCAVLFPLLEPCVDLPHVKALKDKHEPFIVPFLLQHFERIVTHRRIELRSLRVHQAPN